MILRYLHAKSRRAAALKEAAALMYYLDLILNDDWGHSRDCLSAADGTCFVAPGGTFLEPGVADEGSNWGNRACLLASVRRLRRTLIELGLYSRSHPF